MSWRRRVAVTVLVLGAAGCRASVRTAGAVGPPAGPAGAGSAAAGESLPAALRATVATYHDALDRSGAYPGVPPLGRLAVSFQRPLAGQVYAQPLLVDGLVVVATEQNYLYGIAPLTGQVVWRSPQLGAPVPRSALPCGDISPEGITSTPVYVPATGRVYAVAELAIRGRVEHELVAVDPKTGRVLGRVRVDPPGQDGRPEQARGALLADNGAVYVSFGGLAGDCGQYHGYLVEVPDRGRPLRYYRTPSARAGAIWAPPGPVADGDGNLYLAVGNGAASTGRWDRTDSVLELSASLRLLGGFAPSSWPADNAGDLDLGSSSPALLADGLVLQVGKRGIAYLLRAGRLRGVGTELSATSACPTYGGDAFAGSSVYLPCDNGLEKVRFSAAGRLVVVWHQIDLDANLDGSPVLGGGDVFLTDAQAGTLVVLSQRSGQLLAQVAIGALSRFATPLLAGARVYLGTDAGLVGLTGA